MIKVDNINWDKFKNILEFAKTIPQEKFDIGLFRDDESDDSRPECNTVGCVIGHATALDPELVSKHFDPCEGIHFYSWYKAYVEDKLVEALAGEDPIWDWCFNSMWSDTDNTIAGAIKRMQFAYDNRAVPEDYWLQAVGTNEYMFKN